MAVGEVRGAGEWQSRVAGERVAKENGGLLELLETRVAHDAFLPLPEIAGFAMMGRVGHLRADALWRRVKWRMA